MFSASARFSPASCGPRLDDKPPKPPAVAPEKRTGPSCHKAVADVFAVPNYDRAKISKIGEVVVFASNEDHLDGRLKIACALLKTHERQRKGRTIILGEKAANKTNERCLDECTGGEFFDAESGSTRTLF